MDLRRNLDDIKKIDLNTDFYPGTNSGMNSGTYFLCRLNGAQVIISPLPSSLLLLNAKWQTRSRQNETMPLICGRIMLQSYRSIEVNRNLMSDLYAAVDLMMFI